MKYVYIYIYPHGIHDQALFRPCLDDGRIVAIPQRLEGQLPEGPCYSPAENLTTNSRRGANFVFSEPPPEASDDCAFISFLYTLDGSI